MSNIAVDFDDTFTDDEALWKGFIIDAERRGHCVYIVTGREDCPEHRTDVQGSELLGGQHSPRTGLTRRRHLFTGGVAKEWYCEQLGIHIDIWCDDQPKFILNGR